LGQKIGAYEKAGAVATKRVQAAARAVAAENAVLRDLARARLGWSEQELDRHISQGMFHNPTPALNQLRGTGDCVHRQRGPRPHGEGSEQQLVALPKIHQIGKEKSKNGLDESTPPLVPPSHISDVEAQDSAVVPRTCASAPRNGGGPDQNFVPRGNTMPKPQADAMMLGQNRNHGGPNEDVSPDSSSHANNRPPFLGTSSTGKLELIREELGWASLGTWQGDTL